jgi:hypothetical protein
MSGRDRREIVELLGKHFPELVDMSSDEVAAYVDAQAGVITKLTAPNTQVFDTWRVALQERGYEGVMPYSKARLAEMAALGERFKTDMVELRAKWGQRVTDGAKPLDKDEEALRRVELEAIARERGRDPAWVEHVLDAERVRGAFLVGNGAR